MEQRSRINNIDIKGVPAKKGEDCTAILRKMGDVIGCPSESANVYVNDHLTPENKRLFAQALSLKKEKHWKFLWVDNGRIKARKSEDSRVHVITNMQDLSVIRE
ncbi:hypothetical protein HPB49_010641 [Dermacentor silvarum]|uniref:Uncharacterized protein n=1 Tax=Dermacentor silvarum TaxID=543639 RepID=A0ACB8DJ16_DERSI|nr:hypothetical protein HPB49_010641 [Dermacentor silvarum]